MASFYIFINDFLRFLEYYFANVKDEIIIFRELDICALYKRMLFFFPLDSRNLQVFTFRYTKNSSSVSLSSIKGKDFVENAIKVGGVSNQISRHDGSK